MTGKQKKKIYQSITEIDDRFVEEAAEESVAEIRAEVSQEDQGTAAGTRNAEKKTAKRLRILRMALGLAAAAAVAAAGIIFLPKILPEKNRGARETAYPTRFYSDDLIPGGKDAQAPVPGGAAYPTQYEQRPAPGPDGEIAYEKRWDEKTMDEKYSSLDFGGLTYRNRASRVPEARLGEAAGEDLTAYGYDAYAKLEGTEEVKRIAVEARRITGVSEKIALAVRLEGEDHFTSFVASPSFDVETRPATLGDFLRDWNLAEDLRPGTVYTYQDIHPPVIALCFEGADRAEVLSKLLHETGLARIEELPKGAERVLYSIAVYDDVLGIENLALSVYEGGYLWTNLTGTATIFRIDEADAQAFLNYAKAELKGYELVMKTGSDGIPDDGGVPEAMTEMPLETVVHSSEGGRE